MSDHCKIFAKGLALKAECLAASKDYDAARAWSLLDSRAQNVLKELCAAGEAAGRNPMAPKYCDACFSGEYPVAPSDMLAQGFQMKTAAE